MFRRYINELPGFAYIDTALGGGGVGFHDRQQLHTGSHNTSDYCTPQKLAVNLADACCETLANVAANPRGHL